MAGVRGIKTRLAQCMTLQKQCLNVPLLSIPCCTLENVCLVRTVINNWEVCLVIGLVVWLKFSQLDVFHACFLAGSAPGIL